MSAAVCLVLAALALRAPEAAAQRPLAEPGRAAAERAAWRGLERLEGAELAMVRAGRRPGARSSHERETIGRRDSLLAAVRGVLDSIVAAPWGDSVLADLQAAWPGSALLREYAARRAEIAGRDADAVALYTDALRDRPADAALLRSRAAALARLDRTGEARRDLALALDLDPENAAGWRALLALDESRGTLDTLLRQVRRQALRLPQSAIVGDHEVEVLQRLGRLDEAADVARRRREARP